MSLEPGELIDQSFEQLTARDLLAFPEGSPRKGAPELPQLFQAWKAAARLETEDADRNDLRELLQDALGAEWPIQIDSAVDGRHLLLSRRGKGDRVQGQWIPGRGNPVLLVHPDGVEAALREGLADEVLRSGRPLLTIDPFRSAPERAQNFQSRQYFLSYNQTEDAHRAQDILTALAFLKVHERGRVELVGLGDAGIWCLFAAAAMPMDVDLLVDLNGFSGSDADFRDRFFVPGIQRAGRLQAALRLVNRARAVMPAKPISR